jgi:hypothetical protein
VLEGLEGALSEAGSSMDKRTLDRTISALDSRVFLLHNVHEDKPQIFMTRWAMSYLRGPLTRRQIRILMASRKAADAPASAPVSAPTTASSASYVDRAPAQAVAAPAAASVADALPAGLSRTPPQIDPDIPQFFLRADTSAQQALRLAEEDRRIRSLTPETTELVYEAKVLASATVDFVDQPHDIHGRRELRYLAEPSATVALLDWDESEVELDERDLEGRPEGDALFFDLPEGLGREKELTALKKDLADHLYRGKRLNLWRNLKLKLYAKADETEEEFDQRCRKAADDIRDDKADKIKDTFEARIDRVEVRLRKEQRELTEDEAEHQARKREEMIGIGESILNVLTRKRAGSALSKASRKRRMTTSAAADIAESEATIADLEEEIAELKQEMLEEMADLDEQIAELLDARGGYAVKPRRMDVKIELFGVGWVPTWRIVGPDSRGREAEVFLPAYRAV